MKKILTLVAVAAASLFMASQAHAQIGIIAGLTSSSTSISTSEDVQSIALYHAGIIRKCNLGSGFALQPGVIYQVKGAKLGEISGETTASDFALKTGYVEIPVAIQWGPQIQAFRPFVFAEPFIGYAITSSDKGNDTIADWAEQAKNKLEYGFGLGGGLEITEHIQLSCQYFNNLGTMFNAEKVSGETYWKNVKNFKGIKFSLAILF